MINMKLLRMIQNIALFAIIMIQYYVFKGNLFSVIVSFLAMICTLINLYIEYKNNKKSKTN